jgi:Tol biopolymer transport system component
MTLCVSDRDGANVTEVLPPTAMSARTDLARVAWAGDRLVHGTIVNGRATIAVMPRQRAGTDEVVTTGMLPSMTSDGRQVVFVSPQAGEDAGLWRVDIDGRHLVHLVGGAVNSPVVTRDDRRVIFVSARSGLQSLWSVSINGGAATQLANVYAYQPDVSLDGNHLLFGASRSTRGVLAACELPGCTGLRTIKTPPSGPISRWMPDGRGIVYRDGGRGFGDPGANLWVQPLDGGARYPLTHFTDDRAITDFAWSADGSRLAIARTTITDDIVLFRGLRR